MIKYGKYRKHILNNPKVNKSQHTRCIDWIFENNGSFLLNVSSIISTLASKWCFEFTLPWRHTFISPSQYRIICCLSVAFLSIFWGCWLNGRFIFFLLSKATSNHIELITQWINLSYAIDWISCSMFIVIVVVVAFLSHFVCSHLYECIQPFFSGKFLTNLLIVIKYSLQYSIYIFDN